MNYRDAITRELREYGNEYIESNERAKEIISKGYAVLVEEIMEDATTEDIIETITTEEIIEDATVKVEMETARKKTNAKK